MTDREPPDGNGAELFSLDDFRAYVKPPEPIEAETIPQIEYAPADYMQFNVVQRAINQITGVPNKRDLVLLTRVSHEPRRVVATKTGKVLFLSVNLNSDDIETITIDLDIADEVEDKRLRTPLERYYLCSLVARHLLINGKRIDPSAEVLNPTVGNEEFHIDKAEEISRWLDITTWRASARIGLIAVSEFRTSLMQNMRRYLNTVLDDRLHHLHSLSNTATHIGYPQPEIEMYDWLIGLCNPLNPHDLLRVDKKFNKKSDDSA